VKYLNADNLKVKAQQTTRIIASNENVRDFMSRTVQFFLYKRDVKCTIE